MKFNVTYATITYHTATIEASNVDAAAAIAEQAIENDLPLFVPDDFHERLDTYGLYLKAEDGSFDDWYSEG